jgi:hypothetical protein
MFLINDKNYFSKENNLKYMSASMLKSFMDCEAKALAEIKGEYEREKTVALLVGSYVDAYFEGSLETFQNENSEIFTQKGELKSNFKQAEYIIERVERDPMFMKYMAGDKQVIKTGEIDGIPFKSKIDSYHKGKAIVDLKVVKDFQKIWKDGLKLSFVEYWKYDIQGAIYQAVEGNNLPFFIAAVTKEKEPDLALINIPQERLDYCLDIVKQESKRYQELKQGIGEPSRCEQCDYCKRTKVLTEIISYEDIGI